MKVEDKMVAPKIVLWGVKASPYVKKVMVALAEKDIIYDHKETLPKILLELTNQTIPVELMNASPLGKIPVLGVDDFCLADSAVISAYLERKFPEKKSLYPINPEEYARVLWYEKFADTSLSDITYKKIFFEGVIKPAILGLDTNQEIMKNAIQIELPPMLDYINQSVTKTAYIAGDEFSIADIAITVQLIALKTANVAVSEDRWPQIKNYFNKVVNRPSFCGII